MPVIRIDRHAGRSKQVKSESAQRISKELEDVAHVKPEALHILLHDVEKHDWGIPGRWPLKRRPINA